MDFLMGRKFTGQGNQGLHSFTSQHRASFHMLQRCADHMELELPNDRTQVGWMLEATKDCPDKDVAAALAAIRIDDGVNGMRQDFERTVAFLLPFLNRIGRQ